MAQGAAKNKGKGKVSGGRAKTGTMRKGRIAIAPKVTQKVREAAHKKVCRVPLLYDWLADCDSNYRARLMIQLRNRWSLLLHLGN